MHNIILSRKLFYVCQPLIRNSLFFLFSLQWILLALETVQERRKNTSIFLKSCGSESDNFSTAPAFLADIIEFGEFKT